MIENSRHSKAGVGDDRASSRIFQVCVAFFFDFIPINVLLGDGLGGGCKFGDELCLGIWQLSRGFDAGLQEPGRGVVFLFALIWRS